MLIKAKITGESWLERNAYSKTLPEDSVYTSDKAAGKFKIVFWSSEDAYPVFSIEGSDGTVPEEFTVTSGEVSIQLYSVKDISDKETEYLERLKNVRQPEGQTVKYMYIDD